MNDTELIDLIANTWISNGGDAEGFGWSELRIRHRIEELEQAKKGAKDEPDKNG